MRRRRRRWGVCERDWAVRVAAAAGAVAAAARSLLLAAAVVGPRASLSGRSPADGARADGLQGGSGIDVPCGGAAAERPGRSGGKGSFLCVDPQRKEGEREKKKNKGAKSSERRSRALAARVLGCAPAQRTRWPRQAASRPASASAALDPSPDD